MPEYSRMYVEQKGTTEVSFDELCEIARYQIEQIKSESDLEAVCPSEGQSVRCQAKPVFFDTELIVTKVWFDYAFGKVPVWFEEAIRQYPMDVYLLTYPDLPWVPDPARSNGSDEIRQELFQRYESEIQALDIPYYIIKHC